MLFYFLSKYINIFRYLTFRSFGAAVTSFLLILLFAPKIINKLKEMRFGQQVREEGPSAHLSKTGTPTMGGVFLWGSCIISVLLWGSWNGFILISCLTVLLFGLIGFIDDYAKIKQKDTKGVSPKGKLLMQSGFALIVLALINMMPQYHQNTNILTLNVVNQDAEIVATTNVNLMEEWTWTASYDSNTKQGIYQLIGQVYNPETAKINREIYFDIPVLLQDRQDVQKFSSKILTNDGFTITKEITRVSVDSAGISDRQSQTVVAHIFKARLFRAFLIPMYTKVVWYWPLWLAFLFFIIIIVGYSNATNLSDGLDGLAIGMGMSFYLPFGVFAYLMGNIILSGYLFYPYIPGIGELTIFISAAIGAFIGFLWYNVHPAEVFMGDTGSLPMGAVVAAIAIMLKQEILLLIAGFMFVLETVSVILQVLWYKKFKTRIFKMAPIHHHFELSGWKENQVVVRFWIMSAFCAILALATIKLR